VAVLEALIAMAHPPTQHQVEPLGEFQELVEIREKQSPVAMFLEAVLVQD
jgi:hypothetical protein